MRKKQPKTAEEVRRTELYKKFSAAYDRANKSDPNSAQVKELRALLDAHPDENLWRIVHGPHAVAMAGLLAHNMLTPGITEAWRRRMDALREELGHRGAPPVEKLLINHVVLCWLRLNMCEFIAANALNQAVSLQLANFMEKRLVQAQRRFTRACLTLERVRTLTAARHLIEARTDAAGGAKRVTDVRPVRALEAG